MLLDLLKGHCSDPPGFDFYHQKLNKRGEPAFNSLGLPLLECSRGTNLTECVHKHIMTTFGSWVTGVEMSDALLAFSRHVYNQHVSERRRLGFPVLGHPFTWLTDLIQRLVWLSSVLPSANHCPQSSTSASPSQNMQHHLALAPTRSTISRSSQPCSFSESTPSPFRILYPSP